MPFGFNRRHHGKGREPKSDLPTRKGASAAMSPESGDLPRPDTVRCRKFVASVLWA